ncbi:MAG TPA: DUF4360 domain-containing protein [Pseudobdellovibrionaceae bacterium]|nr:DUF4360 domain-containing protein [Pseudobdellovibrionaceae bacterium]
MKGIFLVQATLLALLLVASNISKAEEGLKLGSPSYGGSGCPAGSAQANLSPDQNELSILFDSYLVEAGGGNKKTVDRKACTLSIPVHVPQGYSVSIFQVDYRGFASIPSRGRVDFTAEYFFAGGRGPQLKKSLMGPQVDTFTFTDELLAEGYVWSRCGDSVNLRINTSLMAMTNRNKEQTLASVDSADVSNSLIYHLQWKRCN